MKILSVTIHNIASIEGPYTIDFEAEPLKSAGLFAITGATGAGKSTLLDAICLALYNDTPRLASTKPSVSIADGATDIPINNVKHLLRKGATYASAKVSFLATDGKVYESEWSVQRARKKATGTLQAEVIRLRCLSDNEVYPEGRKSLVLERIRELLGLSFDEFTKSVILAQGDFTSFLKADDNTRSDILEKLTGTQIYSQISKLVFEKNKQHKAALELLDARLAEANVLSEEARAALQGQITDLTGDLKALRATIDLFTKEQQWYTTRQRLEEQLAEAEAQLRTALDAGEAHKAAFAELAIIEALQAIKTDVLNQKSEQEALVQAEEDLKVATAQLNEISALKDRLASDKDSTQQALDKAQEEFYQLKPSIEAAKELETRISERQQSLQAKEQQVAAKQQQLTNKEKEREELTQRIAKGEVYLQQKNSWITAHPTYGILLNNEQWLRSLAAEYQQLSEQIARKSLNLSEQEAAQQQLATELTAERALFTTKQEELAKQQQDYTQLKQQLDKIDVEVLHQKQNTYTRELQIYQEDKTTLQQIATYQEVIAKTANHLEALHQAEQRDTVRLKELETSKQAAEIKYETTEQLYQKAQIEHSESVTALRESLTEGEACPVCGATHHPYAHSAAAEHILASLQEELNRARTTLTEQNNTYVATAAQLKHTSESIIEQTQRLKEQEAQLQQAERTLQQSSKSNEYTEGQALAYITDRIAELTILSEENNRLFEQHNALKKQSDSAFLTVEGTRRALDTLKEKLTSLEEQHQQINSETQTLSLEKESYVQQQTSQLSQLSRLQLEEEWHTLFKRDTAQFTTKISTAISELRSVSAEVEKAKEKLSVYAQKNIQFSSEIDSLKKDTAQQQTTLQQERTEVEKLISERAGLLEGKHVSAVEASYTTAIQTLTQTLQQQQQAFNEANLQHTELQSKAKSLREAQHQSAERIASAEERITKWIATHYPDSVDEVYRHRQEWAAIPHTQLQALRTKQQQIEANLLKQRTIVEQSSQRLNEHLQGEVPSLSQSELSAQLQATEQQHDSLHQQLVLKQGELLADTQQQASVKTLQVERTAKATEAERWAQLNSLIGSADGHRFRQYAQEYTLEMLLRHANQQMKYINRRYSLQRIPSSLSIQVVDHDMGDEIRSVYSLSGGESFLVSLALALALSSLSSTNMNIETLFIDEGFGALDVDTLSVALDALESLQNQGKKVGVISHVQEMVERIPVKIQVKKEGNGKSVISS